jgi:hypothetical protein
MTDEDFLLPDERKFPIINANDVEVAIYEFQSIEYRMRREVFLDKLTRKVRSLGPKFVKSLSKTIKDTLNIESMRVSKNPQDYAYQNKEEAIKMSEQLGLKGFHECTSVKLGTVYVPGSSRIEFLNWFKEAIK